jgi:hypothetical protein
MLSQDSSSCCCPHGHAPAVLPVGHIGKPIAARERIEGRDTVNRWSHGGSNPEPPPCKGGALPIEL